MIKLIINNETEHALIVNEMNYNSTMEIDNFSSSQTTINLNVNLDQISTIKYFENVQIVSLEIINIESDDSISTLTFTEELYFTSYNANIYDENARVYALITKINRPEIEE